MSRTANRRLLGVLGAAVLAVGTVVAAVAPANAGTAAHKSANNVRNVCGTPKPGFDRCFAQIRTDVHEPAHIGHASGTANAAAAALPAGFGPADLRSAYNLPATGGANQTVAIVDAGDDPTAEADLAVYRSTYGLPACTTANRCFHKVNEPVPFGHRPFFDPPADQSHRPPILTGSLSDPTPRGSGAPGRTSSPAAGTCGPRSASSGRT
jgi:hypothetical protein